MVDEVLVRESRPEDVHLAEQAAALIAEASSEYDIAQRDPAWLAKKIEARRAALALVPDPSGGEQLVGFGYWSSWEADRFVSHSGLVVRPDQRGTGLGSQLKRVLFESSRRQLPAASLMSLTTSPQVRKLNLALGFRIVPLDELTRDPAFWEGCKTCRNYAEVQARGERCCCEGMLLRPEDAPA